jgi:hypothetical protein
LLSKPEWENSHVKIAQSKMLVRLLLSLCFCATVCADQPVASYSHYCASCGVRGVDTFASQSGQFIVHGPLQPATPPVVKDPNAPQLIEMEPQLIAVTAERTKRVFLAELGVNDTFHDKIHVLILPRARPESPIEVMSQIYSDGFQYHIGLPAYLEPARLVKAIVQVILQEYANRGTHRNSELPSWLVEGMDRELLSSMQPAAVVNRLPVTIERLGYDRLGGTRAFFQTNSPLTVEELTFNNLEKLTPLERTRYERSAHLLVYELLRLRAGQGLMSAFIQSLPQALNWQTAFFSVYRQYFHTPLDFEKWWMLRCVEIRDRRARQNWNVAVSLDRFQSLLRTPTEIRASTNAIPERRDATLQQVLTSLDFGVQKEILGQKLQQIFFLSPNLAPEVASLASAYEQAIETYLEKRTGDQPTLKSDPEQRLQFLVKSTVKNFDELDQAAEEIRAGRRPNLPQPTHHAAGRQVLMTRKSTAK